MSGSTIGGVIGAVVFTVFGGSPQVGWMVGSAIGGYVDPTQIQGPRLQDMRGQSSAVGGPIPRAWGTTPVPCNVIWQQPGVTEHKHTDDGKGSGTETVTYTYTRSYAVMFHLGEIAGVLQIKRNSKIVYDARDDATLEDEYTSFGMTAAAALQRIAGMRAENAKFMSRCTIYTGTQTQNPDPTIESYEGVGNVPAYRGRAYMVITDDETQAGEIAQYEIVISVCGDITNFSGGATWMLAFNGPGVGVVKESTDGWDWSESAQTINLLEGGSFVPTGGGFMAYANGELLATSSSSSGVGGSQRYAFRDADGVWHKLTLEASSSSGLKPLWTGSHWLIAQHSGADTQVSSDGINFQSTGFEFQSIAMSGGQVVGVYATGASFDVVTCRLLQSDGSNAGSKPDLHTGYTTRRAVIDSDGATVGMAHEQEIGSDRRVMIWSTADKGETWDQHTTPFPDFTGPLAQRLKVHFAPVLNQWVVCARDRLAMGSSMASLTLDPSTFPEEITGVGSDGQKIIICGENGMLYAWTPSTGWDPLSGGDGRNIMDVVSFAPVDLIPIPESPDYYTTPSGTVYGPGPYSTITPCSTTTIGEIVGDVCDLSGLYPNEYDSSALIDTIPGYVVSRETDGISVIESLRTIGMFDPAEWDKKQRFIKRSGTSSFAINSDDLVERDGDAFERQLVQEVELLRRVSVGYLDPDANWAPSTQKWERRVGTINARGESTIEVSAVLGSDLAATTAKRRVLTSWGEPEKQKFSLPYRLASVTPTDIGSYTDDDGEIHIVRVMQIDDDSGVRLIESANNCAEAYSATATGTTPKPPTITEESLLGPTVLYAMNLDSLRSQDNVPGMYVAACGILAGWSGCSVELSTDGGVTFRPILNISTPATIGYLTDPVIVDSNGGEPIKVFLYAGSQLSSVTSQQIADGANAAAIITDDVGEVIQFQTATATASGYELTDLTRGVNDTDAVPHIYGDPFVLLDAAVIFVPIDSVFAGLTLIFRGVAFGTSSDAATEFSVVYQPPTFVLDGGGA